MVRIWRGMIENVEVEFYGTFAIYWKNYLPDTQGSLTSKKPGWIRSVMSGCTIS